MVRPLYRRCEKTGPIMAVRLVKTCLNVSNSHPRKRQGSPMKVLVPVKRVVDYNVKVRVKTDNTGIETAGVKIVTAVVRPSGLASIR